MFTSGTTGVPKGVIMSHRNIVSTVGACQLFFGVCKNSGFLEGRDLPRFVHFQTEELLLPLLQELLQDDVYLAYLPLAHIMELIVEIVILSMGLKMGYGSPHTLTDTGVKLQKGCSGDAVVLRPTIMVTCFISQPQRHLVSHIHSSFGFILFYFFFAFL
jgi:long-chain acyl-CoA synthetase